MPGVPITAGVKRHDDVVCATSDGGEIWIRVTEFTDTTVTGTKGVPKGSRVFTTMEKLTFPRDSILRYGRK